MRATSSHSGWTRRAVSSTASTTRLLCCSSAGSARPTRSGPWWMSTASRGASSCLVWIPDNSGDSGPPVPSRVELTRAQGIKDQLHMLGTDRPPGPQQCWYKEEGQCGAQDARFSGEDSELVLPDCLRPRSFTALRRPSLRREADDARLSVSLCDLNVPGADGDEAAPAACCPIPQNSLNSQHSRALPAQLDGDLRFHALRAGAHVRILDEQTVARVEHGRDERALVFTSRPVRVAETIFVKVTRSGGARPGALSFGVTTCDPGTLRPADLPFSPEALVDRKEFWAVCRVPGPLHSGDILGLVVNADGELHLSHNGAAAGMQLCVDASQPLWMLFGLHGTITQIRILGSTILAERGIPSLPCSPASTPTSPSALGSRLSDPLLSTCSSGPLGSSAGGTAPNSPVSLPESPVTPGLGQWSDECTICYEHAVDTVIYTCGHMCLCYACGLRLKKALHACCPICRRPIKDIIKTYRSS
ncbi:E3 ubiquitin-protein ligase NEURL1 isoform X4 [Pongo pygmaeus]|uniref:E3 ubiquitin-protein ligase NEURL1 isoform X4 n=1 Tax=Pongo pygmaeus TaxID=9600 RepID=UPI0023E15230|nr:E3 ubiquitin-protein ligase NEURL1 isoform X4 [Pongo pygmaeus]